MIPFDRRKLTQLDRRLLPRAEYRRTSPALLELEGFRCAVRDLGEGGLRVEPAPAGRVWLPDQEVAGIIVLRTGQRIDFGAVIGRVDRAGLALFPGDDRWPSAGHIEAERAALIQRHRERRSAPRLPIPVPAGRAPASVTGLRDVSATGLRYMLTSTESAPATGSRIEGSLQLDAETVIDVRGRVVRHIGREIAVVFDPPGLDSQVLALLHQRFFPE
jgi:hypothetical protein